MKLFSLVHRSQRVELERERGREEENQFFAVIAAAAAPTPPPSKIFLATPPLYGRFFFFFPSSKPFEVGEVGDGCLASLQQTPRKMNTVGPYCLLEGVDVQYTFKKKYLESKSSEI